MKRTLRPLTHLPAPLPCSLAGGCASRPASAPEHGFDGSSFEFLNRRFRCDGDQRWQPAGAEHLWLYNLHYFHYLWALPERDACDLILDWIRRNASVPSVGWEPYPLSLRIREWVEWLLERQLDEERHQAALASLSQQVLALERQVEYHLEGNHLLENAITLCWAGLRLVTPRSAAWLSLGTGLLSHQLAEQVLPDGSHAERSPMYQAILAESLLRLGEVARQSETRDSRQVGTVASSAGRRLLETLSDLTHPDGDWALVNDCALGVSPTLLDLSGRFGIASSPGDGPFCLPAGGFFGWRADGSYFVMDAGPIGPHFQPGHGHAGALSFELSHRGRRLFTDTGVCTYQRDARRLYDRGTAAHNTVQVDGRNQSEVWASFRCGRRIRMAPASMADSAGGQSMTASYEGPGPTWTAVRHRRIVTKAANEFRFTDQVEHGGRHSATVRLHCAPGVELRPDDGWQLFDKGRPVAHVRGDGFEWAETRSPYHPRFGVEIERACLEAHVEFDTRADIDWTITLF